MTTTAVSLLVIGGIAAYVGFLVFVLALLTCAKRANEAAEHHARVLAARNDGFPDPNGERGDGFTAADVQFLQGLGRRAAHEFPSLTRRAPRPPAEQDRS